MRASRDVGGAAGPGAVKALAVRTFVPAADGWSEVDRCACHVGAETSSRTTAVTPVRVKLPDLGPDAPVLAADCESGTPAGHRRRSAPSSQAGRSEGRPAAPTRFWWGAGGGGCTKKTAE